MKNITITYASRKQVNYDKSFKPCVWLNGKYHCHTARSKKTARGALNAARKEAEALASYYTSQNIYQNKSIYNVTITEIS